MALDRNLIEKFILYYTASETEPKAHTVEMLKRIRENPDSMAMSGLMVTAESYLGKDVPKELVAFLSGMLLMFAMTDPHHEMDSTKSVLEKFFKNLDRRKGKNVINFAERSLQ